MSRSKNSARDQWSEESNARYAELQEMIAAGRSFSGNERHCAFLNTGKQFTNVSALSGIDLPDDGRALALSDWDGDGDVDLWISNRTGPQLRLFRNNTDVSNFISVRLIGNGTTVNRDAIGSRIELGSQIRTTRAGSGFLTQSSAWQHFGLGESDAPVELTIRWPDGSVQIVADLTASQRYTIPQGRAPIPAEKSERKIATAPPAKAYPNPNARVFLRSSIPLPKAGFQTFDGRNILLPSGDGKPFLVALWASWCAPCLAELEELHQHHAELESAGLRIIPLSVNGVGTDKSEPIDAFDLAQKFGDRLAVGQATEGLISDLQYLTDLATAVPRPIPLPSSFLVNGKGQLAAIYKGRVAPEQLLADLKKLDLSGAKQFEAAALVPGTAIPIPEVRRKSAISSARIYLQLAKTAERSKQPDTAADYYGEALRLNPTHAESHLRLASLAKARGEKQSALQHLDSAIRIHPDYAEAHRRLAELHSELKQIPEAIRHYRKAIKIYPGDVPSMNNLAWLLATAEPAEHRDGAAALINAKEAISIAGERADLLDTLAAALAESGDLKGAIDTAQEAVLLAREKGQTTLADAIEEHVQRYRASLDGRKED